MFTILGWVVVGYIAGSVAMWLVPPKNPVPGWQTIAYGVGGSIVGGMISATLTGDFYAPGGLAMSVVGAVVVTLGVQWWQEHTPNG